MKQVSKKSTIMLMATVALSIVDMFILWLFVSHERTADVLFLFSLIFGVFCVSTIIFFLISSYVKTQYQNFKNFISKLSSELEASQIQADQINRQLQLSVKYANTMSQQAAEANRSKGEFLAGMSHHIRTPMNAIIGFSEILAEDDLTPVQLNQAKIIRDSSRALLRLINDLFDFSKIESGRLEVDNNSVVNINTILSSIEAVMKPAATEKGLIFEIVRAADVLGNDICVNADASRFKQCLMNLVGNAIKFTRKGFVRVRISNHTEKNKAYIRFDVEDSGIGIAAENIKTIFEPFSQIEKSDSLINHQFSSTGLGLAVTHFIAEKLGGKLTVTSVYTKGSTFTLLVPAASAQNNVEDKNKNLSSNSVNPQTSTDDISLTGNILVAEDSPTNQTLIDLILKKTGLKTKIVDNGSEAVNAVGKQKFDAILMDIQMPVMNGYEATKQIKAKYPAIPVIALTACAMKGDDEKCFAAGCDYYLTKPIDRKKLLAALAKYLVKNEPGKNNINSENKQENVMNSDETVAQTNEIEIDWLLLMERIGDEALVDEIIPVFIKDNQERMQLLAEAVKKKDTREVKFFAHSVKGACGTVGSPRLFELGKQLENAARLEETDKYEPLFEQINTRFNNLLALLNKKDWKEIAKQAVSAYHPQT